MDDNTLVLKSAQKLYEAECWDDAYLLVQVLISRKRLDIMESASLLAARICEAKKEFLLAIDYYSTTTKFINNCSLDDVHYRIANCHIKLKSFKEAEDALSMIPEMSRSDAVWKSLAIVYENLGQQKNAIYCHRVLIDKHPLAVHSYIRCIDLGATRKQIFGLWKDDMPDWILDFIESLFCQQQYNYQDELNHLKQLSKRLPKSNWVLGRIAKCLYNMGQVLEALKTIHKMECNQIGDFRGQDLYALILRDCGKIDQLSRLAQQAVNTCPTKAESWIIMSLAAQKDTNKSLVFIEKALDLDPINIHAGIIKASLLLESSRIEEAITSFRQVSLLSRDIAIYDGLVHAYLLLNQTKEAFNLASTLFKSAPVPRTMVLLGLVVNHLPGKQSEAKQLFNSVLTVNPHSLEAILGLVNVLVCDKKIAEAIELLEKQLPYHPSDLIYTKLANLCISNLDYDKARSYVVTALGLEPSSVRAKDLLIKIEKCLSANEEEEEEEELEEDSLMLEQRMEDED